MAFSLKQAALIEVRYGSVADMEPDHQAALLSLIGSELVKGRVGLVFEVHVVSVPRAVPEFWLATAQRLAPKGLCAIAVVSESLAVRAAASGFRVMNALRGVPIEVKAFKPHEIRGRGGVGARGAGPQPRGVTVSPRSPWPAAPA